VRARVGRRLRSCQVSLGRCGRMAFSSKPGAIQPARRWDGLEWRAGGVQTGHKTARSCSKSC